MSTRARSFALPVPPGDAQKLGRTVALRPEDAVSLESIVRALPDPDVLPEGTLVLLPAEVDEPRSLARSVLSALGRTKTVPRALRCSALVARGYARVGAATDPSSRADLAWGYARGGGAVTDDDAEM